MWQRIVAELPEFFGYYNLIFLTKAALATIGLSAIGSLTGIVAGFGLALVRTTEHRWLAPSRGLACILYRAVSAHSIPGDADAGILRIRSYQASTCRFSLWR